MPAASRELPKDCLAPATVHPYRLPEWWDKATPEDKAALELNGKAIDVAAVKERDAKLLDCRKWFGAR